MPTSSKALTSVRLLPGRSLVLGLAGACAAAALALVLGAPQAAVVVAAGAAAALAAPLWLIEAWQLLALRRGGTLTLDRRSPKAYALGVRRAVVLVLGNAGSRDITLDVFDGVDPSLDVEGLPARVTVPAGQRVELPYMVKPLRRGRICWTPASLRIHTRSGSLEAHARAGPQETLQVYPNFAALARYAWLAGDRRLAELGIQTRAQRGQGTDFKQLAEYRAGDPVRHIDWKASSRHRRPVVREFQDDRDQSVLFLLDCGRRMRAEEGRASGQVSHFDQVLDAMMLMSYVALKHGDEVSVVSFGNLEGEQRHFPGRKGQAALDAMMVHLHDLQPSAAHSDYLTAAQSVLRLHRKRALVVLLTNFRGEDADELGLALRLLRTRHLVLVASLRERSLREIAAQPMRRSEHVAEVAAAHRFDQARRTAFERVTAQDPLALDVEPAALAVELVNRYHAVKRSGRL
jgi:uncharacterized protein (DUF58 family)